MLNSCTGTDIKNNLQNLAHKWKKMNFWRKLWGCHIEVRRYVLDFLQGTRELKALEITSKMELGKTKVLKRSKQLKNPKESWYHPTHTSTHLFLGFQEASMFHFPHIHLRGSHQVMPQDNCTPTISEDS